jgi:predicted MFS family arabinose efflux permease
VFSILGIVGVVYLGIVALTLRREPRRSRASEAVGGFMMLLRSPAFFAIVSAFTAMSVANWLIYTWLPFFLFDRFHLSLSGAGFSATFYMQAASYVGVVAGGVFTDRWARSNPRARAWVQLIGLVIAAPFLAALGFAGSMLVLIPALIVFGFARGLFDCNTMPLLREVTGPQRSATGYGILNLSSCFAGGVGAALAGWMKESIGLATAFELAALVLVAGACCLIRLVRNSAGAPVGLSAESQSAPGSD